MLVFAIGSFVINDRLDTLSALPPLRLAGAIAILVISGFASSAITDWSETRKRKRIRDK